MRTDSALLENASSEVKKERSYLSAERAAFRSFREAIRLATPEPEDIDGSSATSERLRETYREEVINGFDHTLFYGDSLRASLEHELSPTVAETLLSNEPISQRQKRNLLVETTVTIERREDFLEELEAEQTALETFADQIEDIESTLEELPTCSTRRQSLEKLLRIWDQYETLENKCEQLLKQRQEQFERDERTIQAISDRHALNGYVYRELESPYPVLAVLVEMIEHINSTRFDEKTMEQPKTS